MVTVVSSRSYSDLCTLVFEPESNGHALYNADGVLIDEAEYDDHLDFDAAIVNHGCRLVRLRQAASEHPDLWRDCRHAVDGEICDFAWPHELDEEWLEDTP